MDCELPTQEMTLEVDGNTFTLPKPEFGNSYSVKSKVVVNKRQSFNRNLPLHTLSYNITPYHGIRSEYDITGFSDFVTTHGYKKMKLTDHYGQIFFGFLTDSVRIVTKFETVCDGQDLVYQEIEFNFTGVKQ